MKNQQVSINKTILLFAFLLLISNTHSESNFDIELDPTDFILGGYRVHAGYTHLPFRYDIGIFKHLSITPWFGLGVLLNKGPDQVIVNEDTFDVATFNFFPTVHLGWRF